MITKKKIIIILIAASLLLIYSIIFSLTRSPAILTPEEGGWSIENQSSLVESAFKEYLKQDLSETEEKRNKRLQKYFTINSPIFEAGIPELKNSKATKTKGELIESKECHEQEGDNLCLLASTSIDYFDGRKKIESKNKVYWLTIAYIPDTGFRIFDLGIWDFGYDEELF